MAMNLLLAEAGSHHLEVAEGLPEAGHQDLPLLEGPNLTMAATTETADLTMITLRTHPVAVHVAFQDDPGTFWDRVVQLSLLMDVVMIPALPF